MKYDKPQHTYENEDTQFIEEFILTSCTLIVFLLGLQRSTIFSLFSIVQTQTLIYANLFEIYLHKTHLICESINYHISIYTEKKRLYKRGIVTIK